MRDVLFSSGVRVIISRGIMNFLRVLISASLVMAARSKISLLRKSSEIMTTSISLSLVALPFACEPNKMILEGVGGRVPGQPPVKQRAPTVRRFAGAEPDCFDPALP